MVWLMRCSSSSVRRANSSTFTGPSRSASCITATGSPLAACSSAARVLASSRGRRRANARATVPPPIVMAGESRRITYRSSRIVAIGSDSRHWTHPSLPGGIGSASSMRRRAVSSAVPMCSATRSPAFKARGAVGNIRSRASIRCVSITDPGSASTVPR